VSFSKEISEREKKCTSFLVERRENRIKRKQKGLRVLAGKGQ
jgi:hypothetical protein